MSMRFITGRWGISGGGKCGSLCNSVKVGMEVLTVMVITRGRSNVHETVK